MRLQFDRPSAAQRAALEQRFARLREPAGALDALRRHLPPGAMSASGADEPVRAVCAPMAHPPDRFVIRVDVETAAGATMTYALKVYADARGERIAAVYDALAERWPSGGEPGPVCLPLAYIPGDYLSISPWVHGRALWLGITAGDAALVEHAAAHAAATLAQLHRAGPELAATVAAIEPETSAARILDVSLARCERLCTRWPEPQVTAAVRPLMVALQAALPLLAPARPTLVHGDPGPGNFLWDGARWVLLDLDMFGRTDPAYDVGYLLAQVLRRCLENPPLDTRAPELLAALRGAYLAAMPDVAARNITFFYALTLVRKLYTVRKQQADGWHEVFAALARHADAALRELRTEQTDSQGEVRA
jgi:aminoglycoside phosphotransferase (APT) family kinase protein